MPANSRSLVTALTTLLLAACVGTPAPAPAAAPGAKAVGLPNPASVQCVERGGTLLPQRDANGGEYALCALPNGSRCEEWALFRGECSAGAGGSRRGTGQEAASPAAPERAPSGPN